MQKKWGRDTARPFRATPPRGKAQARVWWYPVIEHHYLRNEDVRQKYGRKFPDWLDNEIRRFTLTKWLKYWDRKTGRPMHIISF
jgi:hypothetical protein